MSNLRGSGQTTRQMKEAPQKALFIWCNNQTVDYAKNLAKFLGREDLTIIGPEGLLNDSITRGRRWSGVVLDHASHLTGKKVALMGRLRLSLEP